MKQSRKPHFVLTDRRLSAINKGQVGSPTITYQPTSIHTTYPLRLYIRLRGL